MKQKQFLSITLALAMLLAFTVPALASEGTDMPPSFGQEEVSAPEAAGEEALPSDLPDDLPGAMPDEVPGLPDDPSGGMPDELPAVPELPGETAFPAGDDGPAPGPDMNPEFPAEDSEAPDASDIPDVPVDTEFAPEFSPEFPDDPALTLEPPETADDTLPEDAPIIDVTVPETGHIVINPYGLAVSLEDRETTEQIAGSTMLLENHSAVAVDVSASAVGMAAGDIVFVSQPPMPDAVEKEVFLYAEFQSIPYFDADAVWNGFFDDAPNQLMVTPFGWSKDSLMRLEAAGEAFSVGAVRLFGAVAVRPAQSWQTGDGFLVNIAFTFTPVETDAAVPDDGITDGSGDVAFDSIPDETLDDDIQVSQPEPLPEQPVGPDIDPADPAPDAPGVLEPGASTGIDSELDPGVGAAAHHER